jgi:predicted RecA/RadA family phage recombinase
MGAIKFHSENEREITASAALNPGNIVLAADGKAVVVTGSANVANGRVFRGECAGVYEVDAATGDTYAAGVRVYLTESTQVAATSSGAGKILIGTAAYAKGSGPTVVFVDLNGTVTSADDYS